MKELLAAIITAWTAASAGPSPGPQGPLFGIAGPFWERAPEKKVWPYATFEQEQGPKNFEPFGSGNSGGPPYLEYTHIIFKVYASDGPTGGLLDAAEYADAICKVFDNNLLTMPNDTMIEARRSLPSRPKLEPEYSEIGVAVYSASVKYEYTVSRTRA